MSDNAQLLSAAQLAAAKAAVFLRSQEGRMKPGDWTAKGKADYVTEVDKEAERIVTAVLLKAFPESVVMGEELNPIAPTPDPRHPAPVVWIVDPLDGTTNFLHGFPVYSVSIAATVDWELVAGVVHHVPRDIVHSATKGGGAWQDGQRLAVSTRVDPPHALISTGVPFKEMEQWPIFHRQLEAVASQAAGLRRPGSAALDLCDVAAGRVDGFWELKLAPWDVAAGTLIVREAGGMVSDLAGNADVLRHNSIAAGNPAIHAWLLRTLATASG